MKKTVFSLAAVSTTLFLSACSDSDSTTQLEPSLDTAVLQMVASNYGSSSIQMIGLDGETPTISSSVLSDNRSDYIVKGYKDSYYYIGRFNIDSITRFNTADIIKPEITFSSGLANGDIPANVKDLVFASAEKAYMIRYGDNKIWIVNPKAESQADFKIGELDISAYADSDGIPEAASGAIVNGKLFVAMQRLDRNNSWTPVKEGQSAYVAVFDVTTDTEIDTDTSDAAENLKGIELDVRNPLNLFTHNNSVYIVAVGDRGASWANPPREPAYVGGIQKIDTHTYTATMIVDDGDDQNHPYGNIDRAIILDENNGYFTGYYGRNDSSLFHFDPSNGNLSAISSIANTSISMLAASPAANAWIGLGFVPDTRAPQLLILDKDQQTRHQINTDKNPNTVSFVFQKNNVDLSELEEEQEQEEQSPEIDPEV